MRKLALSILTIAIFISLAYWLILDYQRTVQSTISATSLANNQTSEGARNNLSLGNSSRDQSNRKALLPSSYADTQTLTERSLNLKLSSRLQSVPSGESLTRRETLKTKTRADANLSPPKGPLDLLRSYTKPLSILAVALLLGMLSGSLLGRKSALETTEEFNWEQRTSPRLDDVEETSEQPQTQNDQRAPSEQAMEFRSNSAQVETHSTRLSDTDIPEPNLSSDVEAEIYALRETAQSRQLELSEIETRLIDREATIEELRLEAVSASELSTSLQQAQQLTTQLNEEVAERDATIEELRLEAVSAGELSTTLQQAQQHTTQLNEEVAERDATIKDLHDDIDNWRQQWSIHEEQSHELGEQIARLTAEKEELESQLKTDHEALEKFQADQSGLEEQAKRLSDDADRAAQLDIEISELKDSLTQVLVDNEQLAREIESLSPRAAEADELELKVESRTQDIDTLVEERTKAEEALAESLKANESLKEEQQAALDTINQQRTVNFQQNEQIEELSRHLSELEIQLDESSGIATEHQQLLSQTQTTVQNLEGEQHGLQEQLNQAKDDLERQTSLSKELSLRVEELETLRTESTQQLLDKDDSLDEWRQKLDTQTQHNLALDEQIEALQTELQQNADNQQRLKQDLEASTEVYERLESWQNTISTYRNDIVEKNKLLDQLHDAVNLSNERGDLLKAQIRDMDNQLEVYEDVRVEIEQLATTHDEFQNILSDQNTNFDTLQADTLQQEVKITNTLHQIDTVKRQAQTWHDELGQSRLRIEQLETEKRRLQLSLNELDTEIELAISVSDLAIPLGVSESEQVQDAVLAKSRILTTAMETNQISISQANARCRQATDELAQQQAQLDQQTGTIASQLSTIEEQLSSIEQAESAAQADAALLQRREQVIADHAAELSAHKEKVKTQAAQLDELNQRIDVSNDELHAQNMKVEELNLALDAQIQTAKPLEQAVTNKQVQIDELQHTLETERQDASQQATEFNDEIQQLNLQLSGSLKEHEIAQNELARLRQELESEQQAIEKQRTDYDTLLEELVKQQTDFEALQDESHSVQTKYDELVYQQQQLKSSVDQFDDQRSKNAEQLEHAEKVSQLRQEEINELNHQLAEKQQQMDAQQKAINQQAQHLERLEHDLASANRSQQELKQASEMSAGEYEQKLEAQKSAHQQARAEVQTQTQQVEQLQQALQTQKAHVGKLANYILQLREKIEELKPVSSPLPVLTNKVVAGDKPAEVPTLRQPLEPNKDNKTS